MSGAPPVRRIGAGVPYVDGSEEGLLHLLQQAVDLSSGSDELDSHIVDWPTRYHLSHQRANLLRPIEVPEGARVLDVGAGAGALSRYLGERSASVLALEGNMARAEVAAERCRDLDAVEVVCGSMEDLAAEERFDLITVVGVLEYSGAEIGGAAGAGRLLESVRRHLRPGGAMVLAIENQLGLKYLMGGMEDHRGEPWVGVEDYPGPPGVRTWSRQALSTMLQQHGFVDQRWLAPFPDYKLPSVILDESIYQQPDRVSLVEQLVLRPVVFLDAVPARFGDAAAAHRVFVGADMGLDVASSFLVVATPDEGAATRFVRADRLAWLFGGHRRSIWRRRRVLTPDEQLLREGDGHVRAEAWLRQNPGDDRPFAVGRTLGQEINDALRAHDLDTLKVVLQRWWAELVSRATAAPAPTELEGAMHPFLRPMATRVLPADHLDAGPSNFVASEGGLVFIDDEWEASGPVELEMAAARALLVVSQEVVMSGVHHPWDLGITVGEVFDHLVAMVPLEVSPTMFDELAAAELALQSIVAGGREDDIRRALDPALSGLAARPDERDRRELHELPRGRPRAPSARPAARSRAGRAPRRAPGPRGSAGGAGRGAPASEDADGPGGGWTRALAAPSPPGPPGPSPTAALNLINNHCESATTTARPGG